jgi:DnaJ-class molecular chaperone
MSMTLIKETKMCFVCPNCKGKGTVLAEPMQLGIEAKWKGCTLCSGEGRLNHVQMWNWVKCQEVEIEESE